MTNCEGVPKQMLTILINPTHCHIVTKLEYVVSKEGKGNYHRHESQSNNRSRPRKAVNHLYMGVLRFHNKPLAIIDLPSSIPATCYSLLSSLIISYYIMPVFPKSGSVLTIDLTKSEHALDSLKLYPTGGILYLYVALTLMNVC